MRRKSYSSCLLCCLVKITVASYCYPDYCHNVTTLHMVPDFQCALTTVQTGEECSKLKFESSSPMPAGPVAEKFLLSAYVKVCEECYVRATAFNLSIEDANFSRLITRYQSLVDEKLSACRYIWLNGNVTHAAPRELTEEQVNGRSHGRYDVYAVYIRRRFGDSDPFSTGSYYFKVAASHSTCTEYGCANSTTPLITIKEASHRILIMIISIVWIPPVLLYVFYHLYKMYRKREANRQTRGQQNCLLVYSPTHTAHVNAMVALAKYLRCCNIGAMIDILDIPKTETQDPGLWCNAAFRDAHVILVATSPPMKGSVSLIYRNVDNHVLRLLKENYPQRNKKYYVVQFPYCDPDDLPEEARCFKRFYMPEELLKLVKTIHTARYGGRVAASGKEFIESINAAKLQVVQTEIPRQKLTRETDDLLTPIGERERRTVDGDQNNFSDNADTPERSLTPQFFSTNIDELNLLGESGEDEGGTSVTQSSLPEGCKFRIDELDL
ncbi:hypothetical protein KM043_001614 [Ampulex compressa]|nr:hypothetical protein KM043_001614 [Ampulex compressa]